MALSPETREKLKSVSTATICTALFKRGLRNQFIQDVVPMNPSAGPMVGEAFTLRYMPRARTSTRSPCSRTASIPSVSPSRPARQAA